MGLMTLGAVLVLGDRLTAPVTAQVGSLMQPDRLRVRILLWAEEEIKAVKIVNRKKLEDSTCECYGVIQQYDGKLGLK